MEPIAVLMLRGMARHRSLLTLIVIPAIQNGEKFGGAYSAYDKLQMRGSLRPGAYAEPFFSNSRNLLSV